MSIDADDALGTGTLTLGGGSLTTSADITTDNTAVVSSNSAVSTSNSLVFSGALSGSGDLTLNGSGSVELTGGSSGTGDIIQSSGTLKINSSVAKDLSVSGGTIQGTGTISSLTTTGGTVTPGNSIGTLTISGNYSQGSSGSLTIEIDSSGTKEFFAPQLDSDLAAVQMYDFDNNSTLRTYAAIPIQAEQFEVKSTGPSARPVITFSNVTTDFLSAIGNQDYQNLESLK